MSSNITFRGLGDEQLTVSSSSLALASPPGNANRAMIRVRSANIFMASDATDASTTTGIQIDQDSIINLTDARYRLTDFRFIRAASVDAVLDVLYFD